MWLTKIHIHTHVVLASGIIGLIVYSRLPLALKAIVYLILLNACVDIVATYLAEEKKTSTNQLYSIFTVIEHITTLIIYSVQYKKNEKAWLILYCIALTIFSIYNQQNIQKYSEFNTYTFVPSALLIAILSYFLIRKMIITGDELYSSILFWFAAANFVYFTIAVPVLVTIPFARKISIPIATNLIYINYTAYAFWAVLIAIGFLCQKKKSI